MFAPAGMARGPLCTSIRDSRWIWACHWCWPIYESLLKEVSELIEKRCFWTIVTSNHMAPNPVSIVWKQVHLHNLHMKLNKWLEWKLHWHLVKTGSFKKVLIGQLAEFMIAVPAHIYLCFHYDVSPCFQGCQLETPKTTSSGDRVYSLNRTLSTTVQLQSFIF